MDSVFFINYYNKIDRPNKTPNYITPNEVFLEFNDQEYIRVREISDNILFKTTYIGAAFFEYKYSKETYEQAVVLLKTEYPGFCKEVYDIVCHKSLQT